jgi:hypothetical protein
VNIKNIREKYPQYSDLSDKQLVDRLHTKYYSDIPIQQFYGKVGLIQEKQISTVQTKSISINQQSTKKNTYLSSQVGANFVIRSTPKVQPITYEVFLVASLVLGAIFLYIMNYNLIGKKRDSSAKLGRWYGGFLVMLYIAKGGIGYSKFISDIGDWFFISMIVAVGIYGIGYSTGLIKWFLFNRIRYDQNKRQGNSESTNDSPSHEKKSRRSNVDSHEDKKKQTRSDPFEVRLNALRSSYKMCFEILELNLNASPIEIKAAFKKKMSSYHPDKVIGLGDKLKKVAEEETTLLNVAYQTLKKLNYL